MTQDRSVVAHEAAESALRKRVVDITLLPTLDFNPFTASAEDLVKRGLPPRPPEEQEDAIPALARLRRSPAESGVAEALGRARRHRRLQLSCSG